MPVTTLVAGLVALLALLLPGVRDQVALSATHQPQEYAALSFARAADGTVVACSRSRTEVRVGFTVTSAHSETRSIDYVVTVGSASTEGTITVEPGESADVARVLARPAAGRYAVEVRLPDEDRHVLAHCGGGRS